VGTLRGELVLLAFRAAARTAQALPERSLPALARVGGRLGGLPQREHRRQAADHQRRVTGRRDRHAVDEVFEWYGRYWMEMFRLPLESKRGEVARNFDVEGYDHLTDALERGKGAILALPHLGGWEWAAAWVAEQGHRMLAVVEPLDPPELFEWFREQREAMGLEIVPLGPDVAQVVLRALRDNRIVCLLCDRDLTGDGVSVEFFGEQTTLPAGPATLALRTGAALLPCAVYFGEGRSHHGIIRAPIVVERGGRLRDDIARITQMIAYEFEGLIRKAPEQWHLLQPNWPSDRRSTKLVR
jgi:phosphatidylinositol dimannoside acyltransferase